MRCKPKDHAFIINEEIACRENIGKVVEVLDQRDAPPGHWRVVCHHDRLACINRVTLAKNYAEPGDAECWIPDAFLLPIGNPGHGHDIDVAVPHAEAI